jgi:acid stress-induced BolA-like protein IbaG/YrbA
MLSIEKVKTWLEQGLPEAKIRVEGDGTHFYATIINPAFTGKSLLQRQRMVYAALGDKMQREIHALSMLTYTPDEVPENERF